MNLMCPDCKSDNLKNEGDGIISCKDCTNIFDSGPQWRKYKPHKEITNMSENSVIEEKLVQKWQSEIRKGNLAGRSIMLAAEEIDRIATGLNIEDSIREAALEIFSSSSKAGLVRGRSCSKVAASSIYTACRMENAPRTLDEIADNSEINRNELSRLYKLTKRKLKLKLEVGATNLFLPRFSKTLALSLEAEKRAKEIINSIKKEGFQRGISPAAILGASIYLACRELKIRRSQLEIAKVVGTSEVTLRNRAKEINQFLSIN